MEGKWGEKSVHNYKPLLQTNLSYHWKDFLPSVLWAILAWKTGPLALSCGSASAS